MCICDFMIYLKFFFAIITVTYFSMVSSIAMPTEDINTQYQNGNTAIHRAALLYDLPQIINLINLGAEFNIPNNDGNTILHILVNKENINIQELTLIKKILECFDPIEIDRKNSTGQTPLYIAIDKEPTNLSMIELLVDKSTKINEHFNFKSTPLHRAALHGNICTINRLLKNGNRFDIPDNTQKTAFDIAIINGNQAIKDVFKKYLYLNETPIQTSENLGESEGMEFALI